MIEKLQIQPSYRYGFNGMERDDEMKGIGNSYDFGARIYDPRLGRFLSLDRFTERFPSQSPYHFAANSQIWAIDINGDSVIIENQQDQADFLLDLATGLKIEEGQLNPYSFDKNGRLLVDQSSFEELSGKAQRIGKNINAAARSADQDFIVQYYDTDEINDNILVGDQYKEGEWSVASGGGGKTKRAYAQDVEKIEQSNGRVEDGLVTKTKIGIARSQADIGTAPVGENGATLSFPRFLVTFHELGGHAVLGQIGKIDPNFDDTVEYENLLRDFHGLPRRYKH